MIAKHCNSIQFAKTSMVQLCLTERNKHWRKTQPIYSIFQQMGLRESLSKHSSCRYRHAWVALSTGKKWYIPNNLVLPGTIQKKTNIADLGISGVLAFWSKLLGLIVKLKPWLASIHSHLHQTKWNSLQRLRNPHLAKVPPTPALHTVFECKIRQDCTINFRKFSLRSFWDLRTQLINCLVHLLWPVA